MNSSVYLQTSIIGYLAPRPSRDLVTAANQQLSHDWWHEHREQYGLYVWEAVVAECSAGDPLAAQERLVAIGDLPILDVTEEAENLAGELVKQVPLPEKAEVDALHIAIATANGINYSFSDNVFGLVAPTNLP